MDAFPFHLAQGRYCVDAVFADGGGMGLIYLARDTRCARTRCSLRPAGTTAASTRAISATPRTRPWTTWWPHARFWPGSARCSRALGTRAWATSRLPRTTFWTASSTLAPSYQGKQGGYEIPKALLAQEPYLVLELIEGQVLEQLIEDPQWRASLEPSLLTMSKELPHGHDSHA